MKLSKVTDFIGLTHTKELQSQAEQQQKIPTPQELTEKQILMEWDSLARPEHRQVNKKFMRTLIIIAVVLGLLLIIMQEFFLIIMIASLIFVSNILSKVSVSKVRVELSTHGLSYDGRLYYWYELKHFFFMGESGIGTGGSADAGVGTLAVDIRERLPARLFISYNPGDKQKIKDILVKHVEFLEKEPKTFLDKTYESVIDKFSFGEK